MCNNFVMDTDNLPKRRGRRPKQVVEEPQEAKEQKRRGRKPTCKILDNQIATADDFHAPAQPECVLAHLRITRAELEMMGVIEDSVKPQKTAKSSGELLSVVRKSGTSCDIECRSCEKLRNRVKELETKTDINKIILRDKTKITMTMKLEDVHSGKDLWENRGIYCRWCCHGFEGLPIGLPEHYVESVNTYFVINCYCSFNCALAHNNTMYDYKTNHRTSLLYHMRNNMCATIDAKYLFPLIIAAPPQSRLLIFGGDLPIEKFREYTAILNKQCVQFFPNIVSLECKYEEAMCVNEKFADNKKLNYTMKRPSTNPIETL